VIVFVRVREVSPPPHDRVHVFQVLQALTMQLTGEQLRLRRLLHHAFEGVKTTRIVPIARATAAHRIMNRMERVFVYLSYAPVTI